MENDLKSLHQMNNLSIFAIEIGFDEDIFWNKWINKLSKVLSYD